MDEIAVTVYCLAYNQVKYIKKTLEGFVMQKTDFKFEVIVHDDASTDGTDLIIKEYCNKYPNIFIPILQKENQYSKGVRIFKTFIAPLAKGKYIACCEGDDFWSDPNKLQKQYDIMIAHPECSMIVHKVRGVTENEKKTIRMFPDFLLSDGIVESDELIRLMLVENLWVFHTTSYFYKKDMCFKAEQEQLKFYIKPMYGDHALLMLSAMYGSFYYINEEMSVYRIGAKGSTLTKDRKANRRKQRIERYIDMLKNFDLESDFRFHNYIVFALDRQYFLLAREQKNYKYMLQPKQKQFFQEISKYSQISIRISRYVPFFDKLYCPVRNLYYVLRQIIKHY